MTQAGSSFQQYRVSQLSRAQATVPLAGVMIAVLLAFVDEGVRKIVPGQPVAITAVKDLFLYGVGLWAVTQMAYMTRAVWGWLPWMLYVLGSLTLVFAQYESTFHALAVARTYILGPAMALAVGLYLGNDDAARRRVGGLFLVGAGVAAAVAVAQEVARDALPVFLSARIYRAGHSAAGGAYNEGLFASPQILAECLAVAAIGIFVTWSAGLWRGMRQALGVGLFGLVLLGLYLARVRVGVALVVAAIVAGFVLIRYTAGFRGQNQARAVGLTTSALVLTGAVLLVGYQGWQGAATINFEREMSFYEKLTDPAYIAHRIGLPFREMSDLEPQQLIFGYGAGTAGAVGRFIHANGDTPTVRDTGVDLIVTEFGLLGLLLFMGPVFGMLMLCGVRMIKYRRTLLPDVVWSFLAAGLLTAWFLLKSHAVLANGFSQMIWFGTLGICLALMIRTAYWLPNPARHQALSDNEPRT
jgi:hypothetical protein